MTEKKIEKKIELENVTEDTSMIESGKKLVIVIGKGVAETMIETEIAKHQIETEKEMKKLKEKKGTIEVTEGKKRKDVIDMIEIEMIGGESQLIP